VVAAANLPLMPDAWVYLLRCDDGSLYTGWTVDVERRLAQHRAGTASRYTASRLPVTLAIALPMANRTAARREEARIKRLPRAAKLALLAAPAVQARVPRPLLAPARPASPAAGGPRRGGLRSRLP
jgi:putative endonuclease